MYYSRSSLAIPHSHCRFPDNFKFPQSSSDLGRLFIAPKTRHINISSSNSTLSQEGLFIAPKTRPINIMCEKCHKRLMELKQQATKLFVVHFLKIKHGDKPDLVRELIN